MGALSATCALAHVPGYCEKGAKLRSPYWLITQHSKYPQAPLRSMLNLGINLLLQICRQFLIYAKTQERVLSHKAQGHGNTGSGWLYRAPQSHAGTWPRLCTQARDRLTGACVTDLALRGTWCDMPPQSRCQRRWHVAARNYSRESRQWTWEPH